MKKILPVITISFLAGAFTSLGTTYFTSNYVLDKMSGISGLSNKSNVDTVYEKKPIMINNSEQNVLYPAKNKDEVIDISKDKNESNVVNTTTNTVDNKSESEDNTTVTIENKNMVNTPSKIEDEDKNNTSIIIEDKDKNKDTIENNNENELISNLPESERESATKVADEVKASAEQNYKKEAFSLIANKVKSFSISYPSYDSNPKADIIIFASYKCPFCHKLFNDLDRIRYKGYNVYVLPIPKNGLNSDEEDNLINFECLDGEKKPEAFINMFNGIMPPKYEGKNINSCKLNIERFYDLAIKMGADGTPFSFTNEGDYTMSYKDIDSFLNNLNLK